MRSRMITQKQLEYRLRKITPIVGSGSYFIYGRTTSDIDYFCIDSPDIRLELEQLGFKSHVASDVYKQNMGEFWSYRLGKYNVITVNDMDILKRIQMATDVCRALKLNNREDVLIVFDAIRDNINPLSGELDLLDEIPNIR